MVDFKEMEEKLALAAGRSAEHIYKYLPIDKARLLILADFVTEEDLRKASRKDLLAVRGIGPKTVDTIEMVLDHLALPEAERVSNQWIIRITVEKGIYREIQIPKMQSFAELADAILWAFDFDNDHAHAFFMDGVPWSDQVYYPGYLEEERSLGNSEEVTLDKLSSDQRFLFVFDFGEEWHFDCQVIRDCLWMSRDIFLCESVGEAPAQY